MCCGPHLFSLFFSPHLFSPTSHNFSQLLPLSIVAAHAGQIGHGFERDEDAHAYLEGAVVLEEKVGGGLACRAFVALGKEG